MSRDPAADTFDARTLSGTWFGDYHVLRRIGIGGMGTVYLARHVAQTAVERLVAVKVLHDHLVGDESALAMLFDEARVAAHLHHPNVVEIFSLEQDRGRYFLIMEYVEGATFSQLLKRHSEYRPPELVISIVLDALHGLHGAHIATDTRGEALHLVHRDVSTDNILIGIDGSARIADFGIAKAICRTSTTQPGVRKGKYAFMSPEQVRGEALDHRSDLFSLGIVLYNALTGTRLFNGPSDPASLHNILYEHVRPPSEVGLHPPRALDPIVMRALDRDPGRRFQSAAEMIAALGRAALSLGISVNRLAVAEWIGQSFAKELADRRRAVRAVVCQLSGEPAPEVMDRLNGPSDIQTPPTGVGR